MVTSKVENSAQVLSFRPKFDLAHLYKCEMGKFHRHHIKNSLKNDMSFVNVSCVSKKLLKTIWAVKPAQHFTQPQLTVSACLLCSVPAA
jgi:hypothetical protein